MKFNMLQNSMDSLNEAIDYYIDGKEFEDERCYKFCIFMLYHSAELILKEVLYKEHKVLIFEEIEDYNESAPIKTIGFALALKRVQRICRIDLGRYYIYLDELARIRNEFQHYEINIEKDTLIKVIICAFSAIEYLVYSILNTNFDNFSNLITRKQIMILHNDGEAYEMRKKDICAQIKSENFKKVTFEYCEDRYIAIPCPKCSEGFLIYDNSQTIKCLFCGEQYSSVKDVYNKDKNCIISNLMGRELGRREMIVDYLFECSFCNYRTLIYNERDSNWKCAACGGEFFDDEVRYYQQIKAKEDWEADLGDMMEDSHYSHLWK